MEKGVKIDDDIIIRKVPGELYMENTYIVIVGKEAIIIDPGYTKDDELIRLKEEGITVKYIILTHEHIDHIIGVGGTKEYFKDAKIILTSEAHLHMFDKEYTQAKRKKDVYIPEEGEYIDVFFKEQFTEKEKRIENRMEKDKLLGKDVVFLETPGHTHGSMCVLFENILFTGDTLFYYGYGRYDMPGGNVRKLKKSLLFLRDFLEKSKEDKKYKDGILILPGHGEAFTRDDAFEFL